MNCSICTKKASPSKPLNALEVNRAVALCLDLPETRSFVHGSGQVMWSDDCRTQQVSVFPASPTDSRQILKEWLFANLLIACSNHVARAEQRARRDARAITRGGAAPITDQRRPIDESPNIISISHGSGMASSVETSPTHSAPSLQVEAIRAEVAEVAGDVGAVFQLIAERALSLTGASGAALAFLTPTSPADEKMICRAKAGDPASPSEPPWT